MKKYVGIMRQLLLQKKAEKTADQINKTDRHPGAFSQGSDVREAVTFQRVSETKVEKGSREAGSPIVTT